MALEPAFNFEFPHMQTTICIWATATCICIETWRAIATHANSTVARSVSIQRSYITINAGIWMLSMNFKISWAKETGIQIARVHGGPENHHETVLTCLNSFKFHPRALRGIHSLADSGTSSGCSYSFPTQDKDVSLYIKMGSERPWRYFSRRNLLTLSFSHRWL